MAVQAGRASGWPKGKKIGVDTFMATALLSLADDAEADRYDAARAGGRSRDPKELAESIRSYFRTRAKVMPAKGR